jgi:hypothetical protein
MFRFRVRVRVRFRVRETGNLNIPLIKKTFSYYQIYILYSTRLSTVVMIR